MRSSESTQPPKATPPGGKALPPRSTDRSAIQVDRLSKTFRSGFLRRSIPALTEVSFSVPEGCIFGLVGPNGAGKTTTIKILLGLIKATSGSATLGGQRVPSTRSRARVGYLPENPSFYDHLQAREYLAFVGRLFGMSRRQCASQADRLLDYVGLGEHAGKPIRKFSKGMIQRLGIAQALVHDPHIVILDEPQSGLDPLGRKEVKEMILGLKSRGRTVLFSSHILPDVEDLADEIAFLHRGRFLPFDSPLTKANPKVLQWQLEVSDLPVPLEEILDQPPLRTASQEDRLLLTFDGSLDASTAVARLVAAGACIHKVISHTESLEDLFVREIQAEEGPKT
ncbi:MAG: ABC transporter ATP-binding protein [Bradymonadales bacterium]|nr:ABC transporter ATP-binding protein [Bradymonadales bacterium]